MSGRSGAGPPRRALCGALLLVLAGVPALPAMSGDGADSSSPLGLEAIFVASGACDAVGVATLLFCTNFGSESTSFMVSFVDFDGTFECEISGALAPLATRIFSTRNTAAFTETDVCVSAPGLDQGAIRVGAVPNGARLICSAMVVDAANATPAFATVLEMTTR